MTEPFICNKYRSSSVAEKTLIMTVICLIAAVILPVCAYPAVIGSITVNGLTVIEKGELLDLLGFEEGGDIDAEKVRRGIKRAFLKGLFDDISVVTDDSEPANVIVNVAERNVIKNIKLSGDYRLSSSTVKAGLIFHDGDVMRYDLIDEAERKLRAMYAMRGYSAAEVSVTTERVADSGTVTLNVIVNAGSPEIIRALKVSPNERISKADLKIVEGDIYDQVRLKQELDRIKELLKKEGYYRPAVGPYGFLDGELTIVVDPGERLSLTISGNSEISTKLLDKEMPFFEMEAFNDDIVDEAVSRILSLYTRNGYVFAQVAPVVSRNDRAINVDFFIYEGKRISIQSISFSGITYPEEGLKNIIQLKQGNYYDPALVGQTRDSLLEFYNALGYLDTVIKDISVSVDAESGAADIKISVDEGQRTSISSIEIAGAGDLADKLKNVISLRVGDAYNEVDISDARFRILDYYANEGYANIDVQVQRKIEDRAAGITFNIIGGGKKKIGKTIIAGNRKTKYAAIRRELDHNEGNTYSLRALGDIRQRLYKLGLFTDVEIEPYDASEETKDLIVRLNEGNAGAFEFGFGLADYEGPRGFAELSYRNLFGMNRQGLARVELSSLEDRLILQYTEPWFLGRPLPFRALFLREDKTEISIPGRQVRYKIQRYSLSAGVEKKLSRSIKAELYYEFSLVRTTDIQPDVILSKEDVGTVAISAIRPSLVFDTRNDPFEPSDGVVAGITAKFATPLLLSETNFAKFSMYVNFFQRLHKRVVLALSARGGVAFGFGVTDELPIIERFFLGGRSAVRGYEQDMLGPKGSDGNPTGGNAFAMGSVEFRTNVWKGVSLVPFFDFGNVWVTASDSKPMDIKYTAGLGLRYATPVGPLRVDYGVKLNREKGDSGGEIHFSVGHAF